jgi:hypothetical protein
MGRLTFLRRWLRRTAKIAASLLLLLVVAAALGLTIDLGRFWPMVRSYAEQRASKALERPVHIESVGIRLATGNFVVGGFRIDGINPGDRPFFTAKRIEVSIPWWSLLRRSDEPTPRAADGGQPPPRPIPLTIESLDMTDWDMLIENFGGRNNLPPGLTKKRPPGPKRVTTTLSYVHAGRGRFSYVDHGTWTTISPDLDIVVTNTAGEYRGRASFSGGTVAIKNYLPMRSDMRCTFRLDGGKVHLNWIDLKTDGARSIVSGDVDFGNWPEQIYRVRSDVDLARMREIFFANDHFTAAGDAVFQGTFHLFKGGHELRGGFTSDLAHVNDYTFPNLEGSLMWQPRRFEVIDASAGFYGGLAKFTYSIAPIGVPEPAIARFRATYTNVDLEAFSDFLRMKGLRLTGRASGRNVLEWPTGHFAAHRGEGRVSVQPPAGVALYSRTAPAVLQVRTDQEEADRLNPGPYDPGQHIPLGGDVAYRYGPEWVDLDSGWVATESTYVEFQGRTAYGDASAIPFYARSADWQESDRLLAGVISAFGSPTGTVPMGGHGEFHGTMLNSFKRPRIEGTFAGEQTRAWKVVWGHATGKVVFEGGFIQVSDAVVTRDQTEIHADGRFSLSYPRTDNADEINARFTMVNRPLRDLRHAFDLDAYALDGSVSGEYHLYGRYSRPYGYGRAVIDKATAYGEPFDTATASLKFEGEGVSFDRVEIAKSGGTVQGAAHIWWEGRYSFEANVHRIPVENIVSFQFPRAPLSGLLNSRRVHGAGFFRNPYYEGDFQVADLYISDEGIGVVSGQMKVEDEALTFDVDATSARLVGLSGVGRIPLVGDADSELTFRFTDAWLDPYFRAFNPALSPFTSVKASGTVHALGRLSDPKRLFVEAKVEKLELSLFDYLVQNTGIVRVAFDRNKVYLGAPLPAGTPEPVPSGPGNAARLSGEGTNLEVSATVDIDQQRVDARANGDANLGILQAFFRDIRSSGHAELAGEIHGPLEGPVFSGAATIKDGRIRYFSLPHSIEAINGTIRFAPGGIRIDEQSGLTAQLGSGQVRFGGMIGLNGYVPDRLSLTASGTDMRLRYPEGFRSIVDAELALVGTFKAPLLKGTVTVKSAVYDKPVITPSSLLELVGGTATTETPAPPVAAASATTLPLAYDIRISAPPSTLQVKNNLLQIVSNAELRLAGTYDRPLLFGRAEVERGRAFFEGKSYLVTHGTIDFTNPIRIEPYFDFEAETRIRAQGQIYTVDLRFEGTRARMVPQLTSDPPLPPVDILSLLFSATPQVQDAELRALQNPNYQQQELVTSRILPSGVVDRLVQHAIGLDTFQITPSFVDPYQRLVPGARLTIGKRISDRVYLTISRSITTSTDPIIWMLEYDATDRLSWVLSKNEDNTYALDVRMRHVF